MTPALTLMFTASVRQARAASQLASQDRARRKHWAMPGRRIAA